MNRFSAAERRAASLTRFDVALFPSRLLPSPKLADEICFAFGRCSGKFWGGEQTGYVDWCPWTEVHGYRSIGRYAANTGSYPHGTPHQNWRVRLRWLDLIPLPSAVIRGVEPRLEFLKSSVRLTERLFHIRTQQDSQGPDSNGRTDHAAKAARDDGEHTGGNRQSVVFQPSHLDRPNGNYQPEGQSQSKHENVRHEIGQSSVPVDCGKDKEADGQELSRDRYPGNDEHR